MIEKWMIEEGAREPYKTVTALALAGHAKDVRGWYPALTAVDQRLLWGEALTGKRRFRIDGGKLVAVRKVAFGMDEDIETININAC